MNYIGKNIVRVHIFVCYRYLWAIDEMPIIPLMLFGAKGFSIGSSTDFWKKYPIYIKE